MAQLVASVSGVVLGGVAMVVGSSLDRGEIFTASIGSIDSSYPSVHHLLEHIFILYSSFNSHYLLGRMVGIIEFL